MLLENTLWKILFWKIHFRRKKNYFQKYTYGNTFWKYTLRKDTFGNIFIFCWMILSNIQWVIFPFQGQVFHFKYLIFPQKNYIIFKIVYNSKKIVYIHIFFLSKESLKMFLLRMRVKLEVALLRAELGRRTILPPPGQENVVMVIEPQLGTVTISYSFEKKLHQAIFRKEEVSQRIASLSS